jgi:hypothetical protein
MDRRSDLRVLNKQGIDINDPITALTDFADVGNHPLYVDKTLLIRQLLENPRGCIIIQRPRKWGKSLNLNMIKTFLSYCKDSNGNPDTAKIERYKNLFQDKDISKLETKNPTLIREEWLEDSISYENRPPSLIVEEWHEEQVLTQPCKDLSPNDFYEKYFLQHPVIFLEFLPINGLKTNSRKATTLEWTTKIRMCLAKCFKDHLYLLTKMLKEALANIPGVDLEAKDVGQLEFIYAQNINFFTTTSIHSKISKFQNICYERASLVELTNGIQFLTELIFEYVKKKSFILIDEYDQPITSCLLNDSLDMIAGYVKEFFCINIKNNTNITRTICTGITNFNMSSIFSGMNAFICSSTLDYAYRDSFGFTENDLDLLIEKVLGTNINIERSSIKNWHNGYLIGGMRIYNPWSVLNCIISIIAKEPCQYRNYWVKSSEQKVLQKLLKKYAPMKLLTSIMAESVITCEIDDINYKNLYSEESIVSLMVQAGYLTRFNSSDPTKFEVPNNEVRSYFCKTLLPMWIKMNNFHTDPESIIRSLVISLEDVVKFKETVTNMLLKKMGDEKNSEADFQSIINGTFQSAYLLYKDATHICCSEYATNSKRIDGFFSPVKGKSTVAIIHEYKKIETTGKQILLLESAIWQVYINRYLTAALELMEHESNSHIEKIYVRGIVFYKNNTNKDWTMAYQEFQHTIEQAKELCEVFPVNTLELANEEAKERKTLLEKHASQNIFELIKLYSIKSEPETQVKVKEKAIRKKRKSSSKCVKLPKKKVKKANSNNSD